MRRRLQGSGSSNCVAVLRELAGYWDWGIVRHEMTMARLMAQAGTTPG
jgi:4-diphosphocytidyl-2C-methyl-D-erythritol kinase